MTHALFPRRAAAAALLAPAAALVLASCGGEETEAVAPAAAAEIGSVDLSAVCPATVVIQTDWNPEAEHGVSYGLIGPEMTIDAGAKRASGPLYSQGEYTGVNVEVRAGGPAIGFQSVSAQMYADPSITLGLVETDQSIQLAKDTPTTAVYAAFEKSPLMMMWDPETYPNVSGVEDFKANGVATSLYFEGEPFMDYLTGTGILDKELTDGSYDGAPAMFVAAGGKTAQQGFATSEIYVYENEVEGWKKPLAFQLMHDVGFETYRSPYAVRSGELEELAPCLEKLVPVLQQSLVDYVSDPVATNERMVQLVDEFDTGWVYGMGNAEYGVATMKELEIVSDGPTPGTGDFDMERVQRLIDKLAPVFNEQGKEVPPDLKPEDLATNEFVDLSISFN
jgi:hypothetical protein